MTRPEDYLSLPYHVLVVRSDLDDGTPGWVAEVQELDGCIAQADSPDELMANLNDAMLAWVSAELEDGHPIPQPRCEPDYSGQFRVRVPRSLHAALVRAAERESVSLNQLVVGLLAGVAGWGGPAAETPLPAAGRPARG